MSSVFDSIPRWALGKVEAPKPPDDSEAIAKAAGALAELQAQAEAQFTSEKVKRPPGRPKGSKNAKPRARLAASCPATGRDLETNQCADSAQKD